MLAQARPARFFLPDRDLLLPPSSCKLSNWASNRGDTRRPHLIALIARLRLRPATQEPFRITCPYIGAAIEVATPGIDVHKRRVARGSRAESVRERSSSERQTSYKKAARARFGGALQGHASRGSFGGEVEPEVEPTLPVVGCARGGRIASPATQS